MTDRERESLEAARAMIERFGANAGPQIDQRIAELEELAEHEAVLFWKDVQSHVAAMLQTAPQKTVQ